MCTREVNFWVYGSDAKMRHIYVRWMNDVCFYMYEMIVKRSPPGYRLEYVLIWYMSMLLWKCVPGRWTFECMAVMQRWDIFICECMMYMFLYVWNDDKTLPSAVQIGVWVSLIYEYATVNMCTGEAKFWVYLLAQLQKQVSKVKIQH